MWKSQWVRWKIRNEIKIRKMRWRVDQGPCKLDFRDSSMPRVEKEPCKLDFKRSKCAKSSKKYLVSLILGIQVC